MSEQRPVVPLPDSSDLWAHIEVLEAKLKEARDIIWRLEKQAIALRQRAEKAERLVGQYREALEQIANDGIDDEYAVWYRKIAKAALSETPPPARQGGYDGPTEMTPDGRAPSTAPETPCSICGSYGHFTHNCSLAAGGSV